MEMHIKNMVKVGLITISILVAIIASTNLLTLHQLKENNLEQTYIVDMITTQEKLSSFIQKLTNDDSIIPETILYQFQDTKSEFSEIVEKITAENQRLDIFNLFIKDIQENQGVRQAVNKLISNYKQIEDIFFQVYKLYKQNQDALREFKIKQNKEYELFKDIKKKILESSNQYNIVTLSALEHYREEFLEKKLPLHAKQWLEKINKLVNLSDMKSLSEYKDSVQELISQTNKSKSIKKQEKEYLAKVETIIKENKEIGFYIEDIVENSLSSQIESTYLVIIILLIITLGVVFWLAHKIYDNVYLSVDEIEKQVEEGLSQIKALNEEIEATQREIILTMGAIAEKHDDDTSMHVKRVAHYCYLLAYHAGLSQKDCELIKLAAPMHDIGKVAIPDSILQKRGPLTEEERSIMMKHTVYGYKMLKHSKRELLKITAIIAYEHHEKWDGTGYPLGLQGEEIHIFARIAAIADVFDALSTKRPYKEAWSNKEIFTFMHAQKGKHFDPYLIDIFFKHIDEFLKIRETLKDGDDEEQCQQRLLIEPITTE